MTRRQRREKTKRIKDRRRAEEVDFLRLLDLLRREWRRGLTPAEAQAAYDAAPEVPISEERIKQIVEYATGER